MLDKEFIQRKLSLNQQELVRLQEFENFTIENIAKNPGTLAACERYLERLIGRAIDINQHIIAERGDITLSVKSYRDTFLSLSRLGVYPEEFAFKIAPCAGLRNTLVHEYNNIEPEMLQRSIKDAISDFNEYGRYLLDYIEKE